MATYLPPLSEFDFLLRDVFGVEAALRELPRHSETTPELMSQILSEAARFCESELTPINRLGDEEGCVFDGAEVRAPDAFRAAFAKFAASGWTGVSAPPEYGGQGLPQCLYIPLMEMFGSANLSFSDYAGLFAMGGQAIAAHAADDLKERYLPAIASGRCGATMCMTEPHCGTDLGLIRTRAEPAEDGGYRIRGSKIFISGGDHDLTETIAHLVLARLPDAPEGVRGISLFLVPKHMPGADGGLGARNAVGPIGLEHKMGYAASATCAMRFDGAWGWLIGEPHRGLVRMFTMVNAARIMVGLQGLSCAETARQSAADYARERRQGRSRRGAGEREADPIILHADVRRTLLESRAFTEGARAFALFLALQCDIAAAHPDEAKREAADDLVHFLTPVFKAGASAFGFEVCNACMQVYGGHGYIRDNGVEQLVRDVRIALIQEGANGVQALDLLERKMVWREGRLWRRYLDLLGDLAAESENTPELASERARFGDALLVMKDAMAWAVDEEDRDTVAAGGVDVLTIVFVVTMSAFWLRIASAKVGAADAEQIQRSAERRLLARLYFDRHMPMIAALADRARLAGRSIYDWPDDRI